MIQNKLKWLFFFLLVASACLWAAETTDAPEKVSKRELYLRARDALKTSLESGDTSRAREALDYLAANVAQGAPLTRFEEYLANMEVGRTQRGLDQYADMRRTVLDSTYSPNWDPRAAAEDPLSHYLYRNLSPFDSAKADSLYARIQDSPEISDESKGLYRALLYSELVFNRAGNRYYGGSRLAIYDTTNVQSFLTYAKDYVEKNPNTTYANIFKNQLIPYVEDVMKPFRDFYKNPFKHKYYRGDVSVFLGKWFGTTTGDVNDYLDVRMGSSFLLDLEMQFGRISLGFFYGWGLIHRFTYLYEQPGYFTEESHDEEVEDPFLGLTVGFTVFDSRFLKLQPFIGFGQDYFDNGWDDISSPTYVMGANADIRLFSTRPQGLYDVSYALVLRFKYIATFGKFTDDYWTDNYFKVDDSYINHVFSVSLGAMIW